MKKKTKNPSGLTTRNARSYNKRFASLETWQMFVADALARLEVRIVKLEARLNNIDCYRDKEARGK